MSWTNISKPTGANYTNLNTQGKEQYDQANLTYDDPNTFYDGVDYTSWTDIAKPGGGGQIIATAGLYYGFGVFTYSGGQILSVDEWTKISKPN